jgi:hypothetical protein
MEQNQTARLFQKGERRVMLTVCENKQQLQERLYSLAFKSNLLYSKATRLAKKVECSNMTYKPYGKNPDWYISESSKLEAIEQEMARIFEVI